MISQRLDKFSDASFRNLKTNAMLAHNTVFANTVENAIINIPSGTLLTQDFVSPLNIGNSSKNTASLNVISSSTSTVLLTDENKSSTASITENDSKTLNIYNNEIKALSFTENNITVPQDLTVTGNILQFEKTFEITALSTTNATFSTGFANYAQFGSIVAYSGEFTIDYAATSTHSITISIPIPSNFTNGQQATGLFLPRNKDIFGENMDFQRFQMQADTVNLGIKFDITRGVSTIGSSQIPFDLMYLVV